jgi:hypothetical protein
MTIEMRTVHLLVGETRRLRAWSHGDDGKVEAPATGARWSSTAPGVVSLDRLDGAVVVVTAEAPGASTVAVQHATVVDDIEYVTTKEVLWEGRRDTANWSYLARKRPDAVVERQEPRLKRVEKVVQDFIRVIVHDPAEAPPLPRVLSIGITEG